MKNNNNNNNKILVIWSDGLKFEEVQHTHKHVFVSDQSGLSGFRDSQLVTLRMF